MPIYEYMCQSCAYRFEVKQKLTEAPVERCLRCGEAVKKVISAPAIMFKGSGWYVTDYSDKLKAPAESAANGQGEVKAGADGSKEKKDKTDQKAPAGGAGPDSSSSAASKETAAPASGSASGSSGSASGDGSPNTSKPSGSSS